jgi:hypothetical protein
MPVRQAYSYSATGGGERRELCRILRDRKKIVDSSMKAKRAKGDYRRVQWRRPKSWSVKKENPLGKHYKNDSLGNSKFVVTVKYFLTYVYHFAW